MFSVLWLRTNKITERVKEVLCVVLKCKPLQCRRQFEIHSIELLINWYKVYQAWHGLSKLSEKPTLHFHSTRNFSQDPEESKL